MGGSADDDDAELNIKPPTPFLGKRPQRPKPKGPWPAVGAEAPGPADQRIIRCLLHVTTNASVSFFRRVWRATAAAARARRTASSPASAGITNKWRAQCAWL